MIRAYYEIIKPGIIYGNALTTTAGFFIASKGHGDYLLSLNTLIGIFLVMACGCVFNNYIDRGIDVLMERTRNRALVNGLISKKSALIYGVILGLAGIAFLASFTNLLTTAIAIVGLFVYVVMYSVWKRRSEHGTLIGAVAGAVPPVVGYTAVSNSLDLGAIIIFIILILWQMSHFYAIAIYRLDEYAAAGVPVKPVKRGVGVTKINIIIYTAAFTISAISLSLFGYAGYIYLTIVTLLSLLWLFTGVLGLKTKDDKRWSRKMFTLSLINLFLLCIAAIIDTSFIN